MSMVVFFITCTMTATTILAAKNYHVHVEKIEKLNGIYRNPNARVAVGHHKEQEIMKNVNKYINHASRNPSIKIND